MTELKIHSDVAWAIASHWSWLLASDTRTLAAQIDEAIAPARTAELRTALEQIAAIGDGTPDNIHEAQVQRYSARAIKIAREALKEGQP